MRWCEAMEYVEKDFGEKKSAKYVKLSDALTK
jgi:hypothetical protein